MSDRPRLRRATLGLSAAAFALQSGIAATVCQSGHVEMIVGGVAPAVGCPDRAHAKQILPGRVAGARERIDPAVQHERDSERRRILEEELAKEQAALKGLVRQGTAADSDAVARTQANVAAVRQELARSAP